MSWWMRAPLSICVHVCATMSSSCMCVRDPQDDDIASKAGLLNGAPVPRGVTVCVVGVRQIPQLTSEGVRVSVCMRLCAGGMRAHPFVHACVTVFVSDTLEQMTPHHNPNVTRIRAAHQSL